jgi:outer membrane protein assembly factor BamB
VWATQLGQTSDSGCNPPNIGVASTASLGMAGSTSAIFVGGGGNVSADGHDNLVALNAATGAVIWKTDIGTSPAPASYQFGSPVYSNGSVYIGIASLCDIPLVQGQMLKVNASTGQIQATFNDVPNGCIGGGIWSTPIITSDGKVYYSTGTIGPCNQPEETAIVELNASDLSLVGYAHVNAASVAGPGDWDFGAVAPFSANGTNYIGSINKNGIFYAFRQNDLSAGVAWQTTVAAANQCPQCGGNIAPSAFDGSRLYVAAGSANGCAGTLDALNPANGTFEWQHCLNAPVLGAVTAFPGVVVVGAGSDIYAVNASTGASLYTYYGSGTFWGPPTVAEGMLFEGNQNGQLLAFAPAGGGTPPTPTPTSGSGGSGSYEAESSANTLAGSAVVAACSACSGGKDVGYVGKGGTLQFNNVQASSAGTDPLTIYYVDGDAGRTAQMSVNGGAATTVTFHGTNDANWNFLQSLTVSVSLKAGSNTILFSNAAASAPDFDRITVASTSAPTPTPTPTPTSGSYEIVNRNSGQALDITNNSTTNGGLVIQWPYHGGTNQQWKEVSVNGGYKLVNGNSGLLLDDPGGSKTNGTQLDQWNDTNASNQWWNLVSAGGGYYYIVNQSSGLYADVSGASMTAGAAVVEWPSDGGTNQQWQLIPV